MRWLTEKEMEGSRNMHSMSEGKWQLQQLFVNCDYSKTIWTKMKMGELGEDGDRNMTCIDICDKYTKNWGHLLCCGVVVHLTFKKSSRFYIKDFISFVHVSLYWQFYWSIDRIGPQPHTHPTGGSQHRIDPRRRLELNHWGGWCRSRRNITGLDSISTCNSKGSSLGERHTQWRIDNVFGEGYTYKLKERNYVMRKFVILVWH